MRGTLSAQLCLSVGVGIIPAYAGNTFKLFVETGYKLGSSPRMRGTPVADSADPAGHGIIPAYAGNTACR